MPENYTREYDEYLNKKDSILLDRINAGQTLEDLLAGVSANNISGGVFGAISATTGIQFDSTGNLSFIQSRNFVSGSAGFRLDSDGNIEANSLTLIGGTIRYGKSSFTDTVNAGYHISSAGFYFGSANDAKYIKYDLATGNLTLYGNTITNPVITGIQAGSEIAIQQWQSTIVFSSTDADTVAWAGGTITLLDGSTFSIDAGNTGNMSALTYIYLDKDTSETVLQVTTTAATAVGPGKILLAVAQNVAGESAKFQVFSGTGGMGGSFVAADNIVATTLSAIAANLGTITAGTITLDSSGFLRGGQTDYNTGTGFFLGYSGGAYKFSIGNPLTDWLVWDGTSLKISLLDSIAVALGNTLQHSNDTQKSAGAVSYTKVKEIKINQALSAVRVKFDDAAGASSSLFTKLYKNGVAIGSENLNNTESPTTQTENLGSVAVDDLIQVYAYKTGPNPGAITNFRFYFDATLTKLYDYALTTPLGVTWQWRTAPTNQDP